MTTPNSPSSGPSVRNFQGRTITYPDYLTTTGLYAGVAGRAVFLRHALRGLSLTPADNHMIAWFADWDDHTVHTLCHWLETTRQLHPHQPPHPSQGGGRHHWRDTTGEEPLC